MEGTLTTAFAVVAAAAAVCTCGRQTALFSSWIIRRLESPPRSLPPSHDRQEEGREPNSQLREVGSSGRAFSKAKT